MKLRKWNNKNMDKLIKPRNKIQKNGGDSMEAMIRKEDVDFFKEELPINSFIKGMEEVKLMKYGLKPKQNARKLIEQLRELEK